MSPTSPLFDLSDRIALVTGGARGLGLAMARALGRHGVALALVNLSGEGASAAATLAEEGLTALGLQG